MLSEEGASLGDLVSTLHNLDMFFTEDMTTGGENESPVGGDNEAGYDGLETSPAIYDDRVAAILNRSLARSQSNSSLANSLADSFAAGRYSQETRPLSPGHQTKSLTHSRSRGLLSRQGNNSRKLTPSSPGSNALFDEADEVSSSADEAMDDRYFVEDKASSPVAETDQPTSRLEKLLSSASGNQKTGMRARFMGGGKVHLALKLY